MNLRERFELEEKEGRQLLSQRSFPIKDEQLAESTKELKPKESDLQKEKTDDESLL